MSDFDLKENELSIPAKKTLKVIDTYIDTMLEKDMKLTELELYWERWEELDTSIRFATGGYCSLPENTHRGVKIIRWDDDV